MFSDAFSNAITVVNIINIVIIHFSYTHYQSLLSNINILKRSHELYNRSYICIYIYMQFETFHLIEKFILTYIYRLYIDRFLMCIR